MILPLVFIYATILLFHQVLPWLTLRLRRPPFPRTDPIADTPPALFVVIPCHNAEKTLPDILQCMKRQEYPPSRHRVIVLADNCEDGTARIARESGADVYERRNDRLIGKGYALDEFFRAWLRGWAFDGVVLFDVDARVGPDFLALASRSLGGAPRVVQGATLSKNPDDNYLTRVEDLIQALIRVHQRGRSLLGLLPLMIGSHGIVIDRRVLEALDWKTTSVRTGDDLELGIRCFLKGIPVDYNPLLAVANDLPSAAGAIRRQRRRWTFSSLELAPRYFLPLLGAAIKGRFKALDILFYLVLGPSFSVLFLFLAGLLMLAAATRQSPFYLAWGAALFSIYSTYILLALQTDGRTMTLRSAAGIPVYIALRGLAFVESLTLLFSRGWLPTPHGRTPAPEKAKNPPSLTRSAPPGDPSARP